MTTGQQWVAALNFRELLITRLPPDEFCALWCEISPLLECTVTGRYPNATMAVDARLPRATIALVLDFVQRGAARVR
jgi:hypothetical protein